METKPHPHRCLNTVGRKKSLTEDPYRSAFARDRDRILHCKAFRRLKHKTQVFLKPDGDHYRTRLTHTLEVTQIARTIGRALGLNEDLIEAISYGHDLGHTPFGHTGERVLNRSIPGGFHHARQSVRVVEIVERNYNGLNLTPEVVDGIAKHSKGKGSIQGSNKLLDRTTLEAQVVRISDLMAYLHHDCDDAIRAGIIQEIQLPESILKKLGENSTNRLTTLIHGVIGSNLNHQGSTLFVAPELLDLITLFRSFMFEKVYENPFVTQAFIEPTKLLEKLTSHYLANRKSLFEDAQLHDKVPNFLKLSEKEQIPYIVDYISGMTDSFALRAAKSL